MIICVHFIVNINKLFSYTCTYGLCVCEQGRFSKLTTISLMMINEKVDIF